MTSQATTQGRQQNRQGARAPLLMTAITLAAIGVLALRQVHGGSDETAPPAGSTTQSRVAERATAAGSFAASHAGTTTRGGMAELYAERAQAARTAPRAIYIVESEEHAQAVRAGIDNESAFRATLGEPSIIARVEWFDSLAAELQFRSTLQEINRLRDSEGLPAISVIDLRGRPVDHCLDSGSTTAMGVLYAC